MREMIFAGAIAFGLVATPAAAANIVTNGDFENNGLTSWTTVPNGSWGTNINGIISGNFSASTGCVGDSCIHDVNGAYNVNNGAGLYQDLATVAGTNYTLDFDFGAAGFFNELAVLFGGTPVFDQTNLSSSNLHYTVTGLTATGPTTRLEFLGRQDPSFNRLDNITVNAVGSVAGVPEPATWATMLLGFGLIGIAMRVRRQQAKVRFAF